MYHGGYEEAAKCRYDAGKNGQQFILAVIVTTYSISQHSKLATAMSTLHADTTLDRITLQSPTYYRRY